MLDQRHTARTGRVVSVLIALLALAVGNSAIAAEYLLSGGGGQLAIGGGLPLPIQTVPQVPTGSPDPWGGNNFPPLLIPPAANQIIEGTTAMTSNQKLVIQPGALKKFAAPLTLGVYNQNNSLYAVRTDLAFSWPASAVTLSTGARTGTVSQSWTAGAIGLTSSIVYKAPPTGKFGGPARFKIASGTTDGNIPGSPVTVYARIPNFSPQPACTHTALVPPFPGPGDAQCVALLLPAAPNTLALVGAPALVTGTTMAPAPVPGLMVGKFGATPAGTASFVAFTGMGAAGATNMAQSVGFPWTVGEIQIVAPAAIGGQEVFTISGSDNRDAAGVGTIQLVSASLSQRQLSGPNANRGWISLVLAPANDVPTMGEWARVATICVMAVLAVGFFVVQRRRGAVL